MLLMLSLAVRAAPICLDDTVNAERDAATVVDVLANDSGLDQLPLAISLTSPPEAGTAVVTPGDTTITFTPPADTGGQFTFRYQVRDAIEETAECAATVLVNDFPVANDDTFNVRVSTAAQLTVRVNDTNLTDQPFNIDIVQQPAHSKDDAPVEVLINPSNGLPFIRYTPEDDYVGPDSLQYRIIDCVSVLDIDANGFCTNPRDSSNVATVSINVTSIPEAVDDGDPGPLPYRTSRDRAITIDVLANDLGLDDSPITVRIPTDGEGNPRVSNGIAVVNPDNTVTFTPTPGFVGRNAAPGQILISNVSGEFLQGESVVVFDDGASLVYFARIFDGTEDRLWVDSVGPTPFAIPPAGATITGDFSGATAIVGENYLPPCEALFCASSTPTGFAYQVIDGDGVDDEFFGGTGDSEGIALIDVYPGRTTDTGGSVIDIAVIGLLAGAACWRRRPRRRDSVDRR